MRPARRPRARPSATRRPSRRAYLVDDACLQKATDTFSKDFAKALKKADCRNVVDESTIEGIVDQFVATANDQVTGGAPGPDVCDGTKLAAAGKKAGAVTKCFAKSAKKGTTIDAACVQKAGISS